MTALAVLGAQWGDEGKGKIVDIVCERAEHVVRFQGGNNAGHTLVVNGDRFVLSLLPSGVLREQAKCAIGAGVLINPEILVQELEMLRTRGVVLTPQRLSIDPRAHVILKIHEAIDKDREQARKERSIGTTGRGIGPSTEDRAARVGIRIADLNNTSTLRTKLEALLNEKSRSTACQEAAGLLDEEFERLLGVREIIAPFVTDVSREISEACESNRRVVFEGAQGALLDAVFGTYPYVTSSSTGAGGIATGIGLPPAAIEHVLGVSKVYATRVGNGPLPSEMEAVIGEVVRQRGKEFGSVTGRPRRPGWLDLPLLRQAKRTAGFTSLAITKLDVLAGVGEISVCTGYKLDGNELDELPILAEDAERVTAVYRQFGGWGEEVADCSTWEALPKQVRALLDYVSEQVRCPIAVVSAGPGREKILFSPDEGGRVVREFVGQ